MRSSSPILKLAILGISLIAKPVQPYQSNSNSNSAKDNCKQNCLSQRARGNYNSDSYQSCSAKCSEDAVLIASVAAVVLGSFFLLISICLCYFKCNSRGGITVPHHGIAPGFVVIGNERRIFYPMPANQLKPGVGVPRY